MKFIARNTRNLSLVAALAITTLFSSCNRGVGCPTNFSLNEFLDGGVSLLFSLIF